MSNDGIIASIDAEIARLQSARALLAGSNAKPGSVQSGPKNRKRRLSAEARQRIAEEQRWAAQKKAAK